MDKKKVNDLLSKINYPGFSRDIVSFGMVDDIQIDSDNVIINLKLVFIIIIAAIIKARIALIFILFICHQISCLTNVILTHL